MNKTTFLISTLLTIYTVPSFAQNTTQSVEKTSLPASTNKIVTVQEIATQVSMPPTIIQKIATPSNAQTSANQVYFHLDKNLNLIAKNNEVFQKLEEYLDQKQRRTIPVVKVDDIATIEALAKLSKSRDISDITLLSNNEEILQTSHQLIPMTRTALDLRAETSWGNTPQDLQKIVQKTNQSFARIVVIPNQLLNKNHVSFLQKLLITVWADASNSSTHPAKDAASVLTTGVNGILTAHSDIFITTLKQFPKNTLLRKPLVIAHRGVPTLQDENTLESATYALGVGADIIENDIYLSKDNHLVVMHDETVDRTTHGHGKIEEMSLAQIKQLTTQNKNRKIPTLAEYFSLIKPVKNVVLMVELKSANPNLVPALKAEVEKYNFADHLVVTSFRREQTNRVKSNLAGVSTGILVGAMPKTGKADQNAYQIMQETQKYASTYNPAYRSDLVSLMQTTKHRGISYWPWALDDQTFKKLYIAGAYGITTNSAQLYAKYIVGIKTAPAVNVKVGQKFYINAELQTQDGHSIKSKANQYIVLGASPNYVQSSQKDTLTFKSKGQAYVLAGYQYHIDQQNSYTIFTAPIMVNIQ